MGVFSKDARLDRAAYWKYVGLAIAAKLLVGWLTRVPGAGAAAAGFEMAVVAFMAAIVGARFRDIGWRPWIGQASMFLLVLVLPYAAFFATIALVDRSSLPSSPDTFVLLLNAPFLVMAAVVVIVAGWKPGGAAGTQSPSADGLASSH